MYLNTDTNSLDKMLYLSALALKKAAVVSRQKWSEPELTRHTEHYCTLFSFLCDSLISIS